MSRTRIYMCANNLCMHTHKRPPFAQLLFAVIHSDHTVQEAGCISRHHNRPCVPPPVIQVFEFAACEGIPASMWHSGICTFCCFSVSVLSATQSYGSVTLYGSPGAASCSFNIPGTSTPAPSCRSPCVALIDKRPLLSGA